MVKLTKAQRKAVHALWMRAGPAPYREFRKKVQWGIMGECVMLEFHGMWIGIEKDGYTHS